MEKIVYISQDIDLLIFLNLCKKSHTIFAIIYIIIIMINILQFLQNSLCNPLNFSL